MMKDTLKRLADSLSMRPIRFVLSSGATAKGYITDVTSDFVTINWNDESRDVEGRPSMYSIIRIDAIDSVTMTDSQYKGVVKNA